jgi:hypothetical protein
MALKDMTVGPWPRIQLVIYEIKVALRRTHMILDTLK